MHKTGAEVWVSRETRARGALTTSCLAGSWSCLKRTDDEGGGRHTVAGRSNGPVAPSRAGLGDLGVARMCREMREKWLL